VVPPRGRLARVAPFPHDARMGGPDPIAAQGWCAELALGFARRGERTVLASRRHDGPMKRKIVARIGRCSASTIVRLAASSPRWAARTMVSVSSVTAVRGGAKRP